MARAEFSVRTARIVSERSGYRCSYPGCTRTTIGPGSSAREVSNTGVAAHIYSASPQGPRGQAGLRDADITAPENAIWLCSYHARLVDNNRGAQFPPTLLSETGPKRRSGKRPASLSRIVPHAEVGPKRRWEISERHPLGELRSAR